MTNRSDVGKYLFTYSNITWKHCLTYHNLCFLLFSINHSLFQLLCLYLSFDLFYFTELFHDLTMFCYIVSIPPVALSIVVKF